MTDHSAGRYNRKTLSISAVHSNLEQELIQITEDKLRLVLKDHVSDIEQRKGWISPLGIFITILLVFCTTTFKDVYFVAATWEAVFIMTGALTFLWLLKSAYLAVNVKSIDDIVDTIKNTVNTRNIN